MRTLQTSQWKEEFAANLSLESWNRNILPLMHSLGEEYKRAAHAVARGRNWTYSGIVEEYVQAWTMKPCQGKNLLSVGYQDGILRIGFHGKNEMRYYRYRGCPKEVADKLARSPFPDGLFRKLIMDKGIKGESEK